MNLITYALLNRKIETTLTNGISIENMQIIDGDLVIDLSTGTTINAGKVPTSDLEAIQKLEVSLKELENDSLSTSDGGIISGPLTLLSDPTDELHAITKAYLEKVIGDLNGMTVADYIDNKVAEEKSVFNADTHFDFPSIGKTDVIYKAEKEKLTYQWKPETFSYEILNEIATKVEDINLIFGGNAYGNT